MQRGEISGSGLGSEGGLWLTTRPLCPSCSFPNACLGRASHSREGGGQPPSDTTATQGHCGHSQQMPGTEAVCVTVCRRVGGWRDVA